MADSEEEEIHAEADMEHDEHEMEVTKDATHMVIEDEESIDEETDKDDMHMKVDDKDMMHDTKGASMMDEEHDMEIVNTAEKKVDTEMEVESDGEQEQMLPVPGLIRYECF